MGIIRVLLAIAVVVGHASSVVPNRAPKMTGGTASVEMFYMISGFYMAMVLNRKYRGPGSTWVFYMNRLLRLYPTYLAVLLLTLISGLLFYATRHELIRPFLDWSQNWQHLSTGTRVTMILANLSILGQDMVMFTGIRPGTGSLYFTSDFTQSAIPTWRLLSVPQGWTLGVELLFYVVAPMIVRQRIYVIAAVALLGLALRHYLQHSLGLVNDPWTYRFFPTELPLFLAGAIAFRVYDGLSKADRMKNWLCVASFAAIVLTVTLYPWLPKKGVTEWPWEYALFAIALPGTFHFSRKAILDRFLGELSYAIYIGHWLIISLLDAANSAFISNYFAMIACVLTLALAVLLHLYLERPIDAFRQRSVKKATSPKEPASERLSPLSAFAAAK